MSMDGGTITREYTYNSDGIRTSKTINGLKHIYTLNGTQILKEEFGNQTLVFLYDENGSPIGMQYRTASYAEDVFDTYFFEKNLQDDIVAIYTSGGKKIGSYTYDAWGVCTTAYSSGITSAER